MKKLVLALSLLCLPLISYAAELSISAEKFVGGTDIVSPDKLDMSYASFDDGILNVRTDEYAQITKRYGSVKYNLVPFTGSLRTRNLYTFSQNNGNSWIIGVSSGMVLASQNGIFQSIISSRTIVGYRDRFATIQNKLFGENGKDAPWSWDGSTTTTVYSVANSTGFPVGKFICYWQQRLWVAGDPNYPSRIYYSQGGSPSDFENFNDIATDDGDQITGLMLFQNNLIVTKHRATYQMYQYATGGFTYLQVSPTIGCLYDTTMCVYNGLPTWLSDRGIEQLNGSAFNEPPITMPIDNYMKSMPQMVIGQQFLNQSSSDWGAGSGTNIVITSGSVTMLSVPSVSSDVAYQQTTSASDTDSIYLSSYPVSGNNELNYGDGYHLFWHGNKTILSDKWWKVDMGYNITNAQISCYLRQSVNNAPFSVYNLNTNYLQGSLDNTNWTTLYTGLDSNDGITVNATGTWRYFRIYFPYSNPPGFSFYNCYINFFNVYLSTQAVFKSSSMVANQWSTWNTFTSDDFQPVIASTVSIGGLDTFISSIKYTAVTATSTYNLSTSTPFAVTSGGQINSLVGPYIDIVASFNTSNPALTPILNSFKIGYFGTNDNIPLSTVYNRKLYCAVESSNTTSGNDTVIILQKDGTWTKDSRSVGALVVNQGNLYYGSGTDNGYVYQAEVPNVYSDDGVGYPAYWTSKPIWVHPYHRVLFKNLWINAENTGQNLDIGYRYDESPNVFIENTYSTNTTKPWRKLSLPPRIARSVQVKLGDFEGTSGEYFKINRFYLIYDNQLSIE